MQQDCCYLFTVQRRSRCHKREQQTPSVLESQGPHDQGNPVREQTDQKSPKGKRGVETGSGGTPECDGVDHE